MKNLHFSDSADADTESEELMHWPNTIFLSPQLHSFCRASPPPGSRLMLLMRIYFYNLNAFPCTQGDNKANVIKCSLKLKFFKFHFKLDVLCVCTGEKEAHWTERDNMSYCPGWCKFDQTIILELQSKLRIDQYCDIWSHWWRDQGSWGHKLQGFEAI